MKSLITIICLLFFSGCTPKEVKPWEKERLSEEAMQRDGGNKLQRQFKEHIYYSKEGTKGGTGVSGGGCGCN